MMTPATIENVTVGTKLVAGDGFTCLKQGQVVVVQIDTDGDLFVHCREGEHLLMGQLDDDNLGYVGFSLAGEMQ